jgi:hypothetical protein
MGLTADDTDSPIQIGNIIFNTVDANGTLWPVTVSSGWGTPAPTLTEVQKVRRSGFTDGDSFSAGRVMTLSGWIISTSPAQHSADWDSLISNVSRQPTLMQVSESGRVRWCMVRRSAEIIRTKHPGPASEFTIQVTAKDWRKFGTPLTGSTALPASSGGFTVPYTLPFDIPATSISGTVSLTNPGNETGPVTMRVDGPTIGPVITHLGSGLSLVFSASLVLNTGEWIDIDMENHTVLANGTASRAGYISSRGWSGFDSGPNIWQFTAFSFNAASLLTVTATPADE